MVKKERKTHREELEGSIRVHVPEVLLEGAGTLIMSPPASMTVKAPECERWRLKPAHAAPLLDTSLSSAACGFETSPRFAGHHELHPGKSIGLEAETQDTVTNHRETISTSWWTNCSSGETDLPYPSTRPSLNSPSNFMPSYRLKTPVPWNFPCENSPSYLMRWEESRVSFVTYDWGENMLFFSLTFLLTHLDPSVKKSTPEPWKSPFSNWPVKQVPSWNLSWPTPCLRPRTSHAIRVSNGSKIQTDDGNLRNPVKANNLDGRSWYHLLMHFLFLWVSCLI